MPRYSTISSLAAAFVSAACLPVGAASAQLPLDTAVVKQHSSIARMVAGVVFGAALLQVTNSPDEWPRTAGGAGRRLGDQAGFVAIRSITHDQLRRAIPWTASVAPCPHTLLTRTWCAVTKTFVAYNREGAPRPDLARVGGIAMASVGSLLWRPERAARGTASVFVASRVGSGLLVAVLRRALEARRTVVPE